jgi:hypothetical protein
MSLTIKDRGSEPNLTLTKQALPNLTELKRNGVYTVSRTVKNIKNCFIIEYYKNVYKLS